MEQDRSIAILGAGPIGLETALYARTLGYGVRIYERGCVGSNVRSWGHIRMFSPWSYNRSVLGMRRLREEGLGSPDLSDEACPTGAELVDNYLAPLARLPEFRDSIQKNCEVLACGRGDLLKRDIGQGPDGDIRAAEPFRLLLRDSLGRDSNGRERIEIADIVVDTTGVFGEHNHLGKGGIPARGETELQSQIEYDPPDIRGKALAHYAGRHTAVIGAGFSAATTAVALAELIESAPGTRITWIGRSENERPIEASAVDPLPERRLLTESANRLATDSPEGFEYLAGTTVAAIEKRDGVFTLALERRSGAKLSIEVDRVIANVGYHPNEKIYRQLQIHECYATLGPMALAASLLGQGDVDCLSVQAGGADLLRTPEPDFYILGAKSFGTNSNFLIRLGHEHIVQLFALITGDPELNLYTG